MSQFIVPIVKIEEVRPHPNADRLELTTVQGLQVVVQKGTWKPGDKATYIPVDSMVPLDNPYFEFLKSDKPKERHRIRPVKLRGEPSFGMLIPVPWDLEIEVGDPEVGTNVAGRLDIYKYEEPPSRSGEQRSPPPWPTPTYDVENFYNFEGLLQSGELVVVTEKLHGTNARFCWRDNELWVGSRRNFWKRPGKDDKVNVYWEAAEKYDLQNRLIKAENVIVYGEIFGDGVQDLKYGGRGRHFRVFDAYDTTTMQWLNWQDTAVLCDRLDLLAVPLVHTGPFDKKTVESFAKGQSTIDDGTVREGVVVRPYEERWNEKIGRVILKIINPAYLARKGGTEHH